jgi:hypothetical protein
VNIKLKPEVLLLLVAFRHGIHEPDLDSGRRHFEEIVGRDVDPEAFGVALADALRAGDIHDPVQLPPGALQCHWHLKPTSTGVGKVMALLQSWGISADELIARSLAGTRKNK